MMTLPFVLKMFPLCCCTSPNYDCFYIFSNILVEIFQIVLFGFSIYSIIVFDCNGDKNDNVFYKCLIAICAFTGLLLILTIILEFCEFFYQMSLRNNTSVKSSKPIELV